MIPQAHDDDSAIVLERLSRPGTKARRLQDLLLTQWRTHQQQGTLPTSGRFLFYELEQLGAISKQRTGVRRADQDLLDQLTRRRDLAIIPWADIVDEPRHLTSWQCAPTIADYVTASLTHARIDPWRGVERPIILCEARTVAGVLIRRLAPEYLVPVVPTNGQCKGFLITEVVPLFDEQPSCGLYVGDHDLSGNAIEGNTRSVLERFLGVEIPWERVAITEAQTKTLRAQGLEPIRKTDARFTDRHPHLAYEAEALGQATLEDVLRERLDALLPAPLDRVRVRERRQRAEVARQLRTLK